MKKILDCFGLISKSKYLGILFQWEGKKENNKFAMILIYKKALEKAYLGFKKQQIFLNRQCFSCKSLQEHFQS